MLCEASAALVKKRGIKLPPGPDVGCYKNAAGDLADIVVKTVETVESLENGRKGWIFGLYRNTCLFHGWIER